MTMQIGIFKFVLKINTNCRRRKKENDSSVPSRKPKLVYIRLSVWML